MNNPRASHVRSGESHCVDVSALQHVGHRTPGVIRNIDVKDETVRSPNAAGFRAVVDGYGLIGRASICHEPFWLFEDERFNNSVDLVEPILVGVVFAGFSLNNAAAHRSRSRAPAGDLLNLGCVCSYNKYVRGEPDLSTICKNLFAQRTGHWSCVPNACFLSFRVPDSIARCAAHSTSR